MARKRPDKHPPGHRPIVPDFDLWTRLKDSVTPLHDDHPIDGQEPLTSQTAQSASKPAARPGAGNGKQKPPRPGKENKPASPVAAPLTGLDRRTSQRLARGQIEVDGRIDLHGESVESARLKLREYLHNARARGARTVLVITGKGSSDFARHTLHGASHFHAPERQGRLRRMATQWFHDHEFSHLISGFQPAHPKHGGGGAFYVRLRRADKGHRS